jgi:hypothetical protein
MNEVFDEMNRQQQMQKVEKHLIDICWIKSLLELGTTQS